MAIGDLFKSKSEREREREKKRRQAFREAEKAVDAVKDRVKKLKADRDKSWVEARGYLKDGQKSSAQRSLQSVRANELMMSKLEMKRWVFEQLLTKLEMAKTDQEFAGAIGAINTVVKIDPDAVADVLGEVEDKLGEQIDVDKIWEKMHEKEMDGVENQATDRVPSIDQMMVDLEDEVSEQIGGNATGTKTNSSKDSGVKEQIGEGRRRLKDMLEGGEK